VLLAELKIQGSPVAAEDLLVPALRIGRRWPGALPTRHRLSGPTKAGQVWPPIIR
jgi:hypothetical protein